MTEKVDVHDSSTIPANDRANALNAVIDKIGETVNPRYAKAIKSISENNVRGIVARPSGHRNNAPCLMP